MAGELRDLGLDPHEHIGGFGVVAEIKGRAEGRAVALRAELDGLAVQERTGLDYASRHPGRMHACGHDGHMAMLLGAAAHLAETRHFAGRVYLVFQPAEERYGGAQPMLDDGLLERFPFESIFSVHNWPGLPTGFVDVRDGAVMAGANDFEITFTAAGAHGAMPHLSGDPILAGGHLMVALQQIVSRSIDPLEAAVVTVGAFQGGNAQNAIPKEARLKGTYRAFSREILSHICERLEAAVHAAAGMADVDGKLVLDGADYPPVLNSEAQAGLMRKVAGLTVGPDKVGACPPTMAGDDFGVFTAHRPGAYARIGNGSESPGLHQPDYEFNDDILIVGAALMAGTAEAALQ